MIQGFCLHTVSYSMVLTVLLLAPLHTSLKWLSLPHLSHLLLNTGHHLSLSPCMQYLHLHNLSLCPHMQYLHLLLVFSEVVVGPLSLCLISLCMIALKSFASCQLLITAIWAFWDSTLFAQISTFSLHMVIFSPHFVSSQIISASISSSFKQCIHCSFSCLSISFVVAFDCYCS